ncbi:hypothetical protein N7472_005852 [Penicillium cf. griseofulvum]|uniref:Xylanolytic transcriptional activator regulatory domain-containing protein n=1 Tax=Penicillium cf. griseofulvum TaxID=2972120 RepID=A0A9W9MFR2_9EURO|nr:hypothetical protein N7472_005852 [Penicillium cf. griseofulvum]
MERPLEAHCPSREPLHNVPQNSTSNTIPGEAINTDGTGNGIGSQNTWSCATCDRRNPCSTCVRANLECITPSSTSRKPRKRSADDLLERLTRLEDVISSLKFPERGKIERDDLPSFLKENDEFELFRLWRKVSHIRSLSSTPLGEDNHHGQVLSSDDCVNPWPEYGVGKLVPSEGGSRYINTGFWTSIDQESSLVELSDTEDDSAYPSALQDIGQSFIFGHPSSNVEMATLHPPRQLIPSIWSLFKKNVDPLVKVLHIPTMESKISEVQDRLGSLSRGTEVLMFAIYYSVVTSLTSRNCVGELGETKAVLLARYRFAIEHALTRARFLDTTDMTVLQAFVIFLTVLRRNDDAKVIWALTGLVVRIARMMGVHRDGVHFRLAPFEVEMRRRLWWQVEDHGCDATIIIETQFDTQMPLNVNDADLNLDMSELPESRKGFTDMTFCLISFELANFFRRIIPIPSRSARPNISFSALADEHKEKWIAQCTQRMQETYIADASLSLPPVWVAATLTRLVLSKMSLMAYRSFEGDDGSEKWSQQIKDKLFLASVEVVEYANQLNNDPRAQKWNWLFGTYVQWYSVSYLLSELCKSTRGELVERAWKAIDLLVETQLDDAQTHPRRAFLWRPVRGLMVKARMAREQTLMADPCLSVPGPAKPFTGYPAIDLLLDWPNLSHPLSGPVQSPNIKPTTMHNTFADSSQQDVSELLGTGFDWLMTDNIGPQVPVYGQLQPGAWVDDQGSQQLAHQDTTLVVPTGANHQHDFPHMCETGNEAIWTDILPGYETHNGGFSSAVE